MADDKYAAMTDEQLRDLEEQLYDDELNGADTWFERDLVLWEMNSRGMMAPTHPNETTPAGRKP